MGNPLGAAPQNAPDFNPISFETTSGVVKGEISAIKKEGEITTATATFKFTDLGGVTHEHQVTYKHRGDITNNEILQKFQDNIDKIAVLSTRYLDNGSATKAISYNATTGHLKKFEDAAATQERKADAAEERIFKDLNQIVRRYGDKLAEKEPAKAEGYQNKWVNAVRLTNQINARLIIRTQDAALSHRSIPPPPPSARTASPQPTAGSTTRTAPTPQQSNGLEELDELLALLDTSPVETPPERSAQPPPVSARPVRSSTPPPPPSSPPPDSSVARSRTPPPPPESPPEMEIGVDDDTVPEAPPSLVTPSTPTPARRLSDTPLPGALNAASSSPTAPEELDINELLDDLAEEHGVQERGAPEPREPDLLDSILDELMPTSSTVTSQTQETAEELPATEAMDDDFIIGPDLMAEETDNGFTISSNLATENAPVNPLLKELSDSENSFFADATLVKDAYSKLGAKYKKIPALNLFNLALEKNFGILENFNRNLQQINKNDPNAVLELYESPLGQNYIIAMGEILLHKKNLDEGQLKKLFGKIDKLPSTFDFNKHNTSVFAQRLPRHELFLGQIQKSHPSINERINNINNAIKIRILNSLNEPDADLSTKEGQRNEMSKLSKELEKKSPSLMKMKFSNQMAGILSGEYPQEVLNDTATILRPKRREHIENFRNYELHVYNTLNDYFTEALEKLRTQSPNTALADEVIKTVKENINSDALKYVSDGKNNRHEEIRKQIESTLNEIDTQIRRLQQTI